jgi:predicted short-subunit dehydrogenase-like oxidoreductase (DUF2520 family)
MLPRSHPGPLPAILRDKEIAVLGAGKTGSAVARLLREAGLHIAAVTTRSQATADRAAVFIGSTAGADSGVTLAGTDNVSAACLGDIVLVTTNDDSVAAVVAEVAAAGGFRPGQLVVHMSGALRLEALATAEAAGATVGCVHPLQSFATAEDAVRLIHGSSFGITPGTGGREPLEALVAVLGGSAAVVADGAKSLYHAAAVVASNYLVAVEDLAVQLLVSAGFSEEDALGALQPLVAGTADNVRRLGPTAALTGPIVRGDIATVRGHIEALRELPGGELGLYCALGRHTLEIAERRRTLDAATVEALREMLGESS